jgi:hypothetical protein
MLDYSKLIIIITMIARIGYYYVQKTGNCELELELELGLELNTQLT